MISALQKIIQSRIVRHILFWLVFVVVYGIPYCSLDGDCVLMIYDILILMPVKMVAVYFTIYYLLPRFLIKKDYIKFFLLFIISAVLLGILHRVVQFYIIGPLYYPETYMSWYLWNPSFLLYGVINIYAVVGVATAIKLLLQSYQNQKKSQKLAEEKLNAELNVLKAQIHPHFLFNTLNNIYALALTNSTKTAEGILKLSNLLNYMLYECNVEYILIEKEIKLIENYIDLEKLRYGKRLTLNLSITGNTSGKKIAPMLILPFVENSFKHGTSKKSKTVEIKIELKVENKRLKLLVENTKSASQNDNKLSYEEGIGLKNVKKRLELIYKNQYTLDIIEEGEMYIVKLDLDLNRDMTSPKSSP